MKKCVAVLISILLAKGIVAQNLVPNNSFEIQSSCPTSVAQVPLATGWQNIVNQGGSADYFHTCATGLVDVPVNFIGNENPATGNGYMGLATCYPQNPNFREYICVQLTQTLIAGQCYEWIFKYSLADGGMYATDRLGAYFSAAAPTGSGPWTNLPLTPQAANPLGNFLNVTNGWTTVTIQFTAAGGENFMTIGNFYDDTQTATQITNASPAYSAGYIYLDDIVVQPCSTSAPLSVSPNVTICLGGSTTLTATGGTGTYNWSPTAGLGNPTSGTTSASPTSTTTYVVTSGTATGSVVVTVVPPPAAFAGNDTSVCGSQPVIFTAQPSGNSYLWSTGATTQTISVTTPGTYVVTVTNAQGCTDSDTVVLANFTSPLVTLAGGGFCQGDSMILNAGNPGCNYLWSTGATSQSITVYTTGTYSVTVTNAGGCSDTASAQITVSAPPVALAGNDTTVCNGQPVTFNAQPSGNTYLWSNAAVTQAITVTTAGQYSVTVTNAQGCSSTDTVELFTSAAPTVSLTGTGICPGGSTSIDAGNPGSSFVWNTGDTTQQITVNMPGTYSVVVTNPTGCTATGTVNIPNANNTVASITPVMISCFGGNDGSATASVTGGTGPYSYFWNTTDTTATISNLVAGSYTVITIDAGNCADTAIILVTEPTLLTLQTSATPQSICAGQSVTLTATPGGGTPGCTISWMPISVTGSPVTDSPATTTTYTATATDANGCTATATTSVTVNAMPTASFVGDSLQGCSPVCVNFADLSTVTAPSTITSWSWDFGDQTTSTQQNPNHCYSNAGQYSVTLTVTSNGCSNTIVMSNYIECFPNAVASFTMSPQPTTVLNGEIDFTDLSTNAASWSWSFGDVANSTSTQQNPEFAYGIPGCYDVELSVISPDGCPADTIEEVCVDPDVTIFVPNAFTPNGNGNNEIFIPLWEGIDPTKYEFWIFDRWGQLIFHSTDVAQGWDGRVNGGSEIAQIDTYVWKLVCTDIMGNQHNMIGHVNLIK